MSKYLVILMWTGLVLAQNPGKLQLPYKNDMANKLYEQKKYDEARKAYEEMIKQDPENGALAYNLGNVYNALGDSAKATEMYEKALKSSDADAANRSRYNLGTLDLQSKKPQEAITNLTQYLRKSPNDLDAKRNLELALRQLQQQQQQDQNKDDKNQKDQQDQKDQQQSQGQQGKDDKDKQDQQQQGQSQNEKDQQKQDQQQKDQNKDQQQGQNKDQNQGKDQDQQQPQQGQKSEQDKLSDQVKQQILDALNEQELRQQKQYQQRKIGTVRRRAKDW